MAVNVKVQSNEKYHVVTTYVGDVTKVDVYHIPTGTHARGNARRYHSDAYDVKIGQNLAYFRAFERLSNKLIHKTIKGLTK